MLILGLESSAKAASVCLCEGRELAGEYYQSCGLTHSRTLLPMAEALLKNTGRDISEVELVAVAHGPGSFTGVRIGVATAKGLCWARQIPAVGVSTLEAMAWNCLAAPEEALICCCMDARRNQIYNALFEIKGGEPLRLCPDRAVGLAELTPELKNFGRPIFVVGDGAVLCYNHLSESGISASLAPEPLRMQRAYGVAMAAFGRQGVAGEELLPVYLRMSQAERERQGRM